MPIASLLIYFDPEKLAKSFSSAVIAKPNFPSLKTQLHTYPPFLIKFKLSAVATPPDDPFFLISKSFDHP